MATRISTANRDYRLDHPNSPLNHDQKERLRRQIESGDVIVVDENEALNSAPQDPDANVVDAPEQPEPASEPAPAPTEPESPVDPPITDDETQPDPALTTPPVVDRVPMTEEEARDDGMDADPASDPKMTADDASAELQKMIDEDPSLLVEDEEGPTGDDIGGSTDEPEEAPPA